MLEKEKKINQEEYYIQSNWNLNCRNRTMTESGDVVMCLACNGSGKGGKDHVYFMSI